MAATSSKKRGAAGAKKQQPRGNPQKARVSRDPAHVAKPTVGDWIGAARLRTLPLAVTPILVGTGAADAVTVVVGVVDADLQRHRDDEAEERDHPVEDVGDEDRGTDDFRVGPARLTASRKVKPRSVLLVALAFFAIAAVAGLAITIRTQQWWLIAVGAVCIIAAWFYTGGKRPYGYYGLGELFVFVFFGLVATLGTTWVQAFALPQEAWFGAVGVGLIACAVLLANNLRDIDQDRAAHKRTLTVLIGRTATRWLFTVFLLAAFAIAAFLAWIGYPIAWLALLALLAGAPAILIVWTYRDPRELVVALGLTSLTSVAYGAFLMWAFIG